MGQRIVKALNVTKQDPMRPPWDRPSPYPLLSLPPQVPVVAESLSGV